MILFHVPAKVLPSTAHVSNPSQRGISCPLHSFKMDSYVMQNRAHFSCLVTLRFDFRSTQRSDSIKVLRVCTCACECHVLLSIIYSWIFYRSQSADEKKP